jgi:hypothetical protein
MNFLYNTPFLRICLALIIGILLNETDIQKPLFIASVFISICTFCIYKLSSSYQKQWIFGVALFFAFISIGNVVSYICKQKNQFQMENEKGFFEVELLETPIEKSRSYLCRVKTISYSDKIRSTKKRDNYCQHANLHSPPNQL